MLIRATAVTSAQKLLLLSCSVQFEQFTYPPYEAPLLDAYNRRFEAVFIVLHSFVRVPEDLAWKATRQYPTDDQILTHGTRCSWTEVAAKTALGNCARLNQALLTSIGSLTDFLCDYPGRDRLQSYLQENPVWMPSEGRFEPLLQLDFLAAFETAGVHDLVYVPEFPHTDPLKTIPLAALTARSIPLPARGTLAAPDESFLFTVDWDSFFTLFYGARSFVQQIVRTRSLEGFFASPTTEHAWFNYSMGCATVTLSPKHWSTV